MDSQPSVSEDRRALLDLLDRFCRVLRGEIDVPLASNSSPKERKSKKRRAPPTDGPTDALFAALRIWRRATAAAENVAPFIVFSDTALLTMAAERPGCLAALRACKGIGDHKLQRYGEAVLAVLREAGVPAAPDVESENTDPAPEEAPHD